MTKETYKTIAILVLFVVLCIVSFIAFKKSPPPYDEVFVESQIKPIQEENSRLFLEISNLKLKHSKSLEKIDSLSNLKPTIIIRYEEKYKFIDGASAGAIAKEFERIFSDSIH